MNGVGEAGVDGWKEKGDNHWAAGQAAGKLGKSSNNFKDSFVGSHLPLVVDAQAWQSSDYITGVEILQANHTFAFRIVQNILWKMQNTN